MKSNVEWKKWGEKDPLYAVATWQGKERGAREAWTDDEFYSLGKSDWEDFESHWKDYGLHGGSCIEIGCGAGRITKQLGQYFLNVTGTDVSQHQLDYARKHINSENVTVTLTDGSHLPFADGTYDAAFSVHVFQHFESRDDAYGIFQEIHRVLKENGSLMVHLPLYNLPDSKVSILFKPVLAFEKILGDVKAAYNRKQLLKGLWKPMMRRLRFERNHLIDFLEKIGFERVEIHGFRVRSNRDYHEFVLATKMTQSHKTIATVY